MQIPTQIRKLYQSTRNMQSYTFEYRLGDAIRDMTAQAMEAQALVAAWRTETVPMKCDWLAIAGEALMESVKEGKSNG